MNWLEKSGPVNRNWLRSHEVRETVTAFTKLTGHPLVLTLAGDEPQKGDGVAQWRSFSGAWLCCKQPIGAPEYRQACEKFVQQMLAEAMTKRETCQKQCFAGVTVLAAPIYCDQQHVATLLGVPSVTQRPNRGGAHLYECLPVFTLAQRRAAIVLLEMMAQRLRESAFRWLLAHHADEPLQIQAAKQFIQTHSHEPLSATDVGRHIGMCRQYFSKRFKQATSLTFVEYLTHVRVEKAKALLRDTPEKVITIAGEVGYPSVAHFNRVFKRSVGVTPIAYRVNSRSDKKASSGDNSG